MATRAEAYVEQFEAVNAALEAEIATCTNEQWRQPTGSEGWPVGVVAHHVAEVQGAFARMVGKLAAGETYTPNISMEAIHESNAQHAREHAQAGKQETLDLLRATRADITRLLGGLSDEQLDRTAGVFGGHELSVARVVEWVVIGHAREHQESIRAALEG